LIQRRSLRPFGLFTMMRFAKGNAGRAHLSAAE
jgi:hypothetical protein